VILVVTAAGFGLLALPAAMRRVGRRLVPRHWALLCAVALLSGTALVITTMLMIAAPQALESVGLPAAARACEHMLGGLYPGGRVVWASAMALGLSAAVLGPKRWCTPVDPFGAPRSDPVPAPALAAGDRSTSSSCPTTERVP